MPTRKSVVKKAASNKRASVARKHGAITLPEPTGDFLAKICEAYATVVSPFLDEVITCLDAPVVKGEPTGCKTLSSQVKTLKGALDEAFKGICPTT